jgi:hypothetical protein
MKELKCSRCRCKRNVPEVWEYKECAKCHARTERRYPQIKQYEPRGFKVEQLFTFPSFENCLAVTLRVNKRINKVTKQKLRKEYEQRKADWEKENSKRIAQLDALFAINKFPLHSQECVKIRIEGRKHYINGDDSWDNIAVVNHIGSCPSCNDFIMALRNGSLALEPTSDPEQEAELRKEGYCSLKEWNERMNEFLNGAQSKPDIEDRLFAGMRECCPYCGSNFMDGKCPRCG